MSSLKHSSGPVPTRHHMSMTPMNLNEICIGVFKDKMLNLPRTLAIA